MKGRMDVTATEYTAVPARYAKGKIAVHCPSKDGLKTRAARLAGKMASHYSGRERAYMMGPRTFAKFERAYADGYDVNIVSGRFEPPLVRTAPADYIR